MSGLTSLALEFLCQWPEQQTSTRYLCASFSDLARHSSSLISASRHHLVLKQVENTLNTNADAYCWHILAAEHTY